MRDPNHATRASCFIATPPSPRRQMVSDSTRAGHHGNPAIFAHTMSPTHTQRPSAPTHFCTVRLCGGRESGLGSGLESGLGSGLESSLVSGLESLESGLGLTEGRASPGAEAAGEGLETDLDLVLHWDSDLDSDISEVLDLDLDLVDPEEDEAGDEGPESIKELDRDLDRTRGSLAGLSLDPGSGRTGLRLGFRYGPLSGLRSGPGSGAGSGAQSGSGLVSDRALFGGSGSGIIDSGSESGF